MVLYVNNRYYTLGVIVIKLLKKLFSSEPSPGPSYDASRVFNFSSSNVISFYHYDYAESAEGVKFIGSRLQSAISRTLSGKVSVPMHISHIDGMTAHFKYGKGKSRVNGTSGHDIVYLKVGERDGQMLFDLIMDQAKIVADSMGDLRTFGDHRVNSRLLGLADKGLQYRGSIMLDDSVGWEFSLFLDHAELTLTQPYRDPF